MIGIVVSEADSASEHVGEHLLALRDWETHEDASRPGAAGGGTVHRSGPFELRTFEALHLYLDGVADAFGDPDLVAFASRHSGETGPLLTAHFTGNFGPADYGGEAEELATAAPAALDRVVAAFDEHAPAGYEVGVEATHHGPTTVGAPSLFVELGSDEPQWSDPEGADAVARAILSLSDLEAVGASRGGDGDGRSLVGFGGGHYAPRFERVLRETDWRVGHVAADWSLADLGEPGDHPDLLRQAFERSGAEHALMDGDHPDVAEAVTDLGYRVVGETWVRETDGVPLSLVERVEERVGTVASGVRFGERAVGYDGPVDVVSLPDDLLAEALAVDGDGTRDAVAAVAVAYETDEGGTRPAGDAALRDAGDREALVDRLVAVLEPAYDAVEHRDGAVVLHEETFDPGLASDLGVPEGPAFGRLAGGDPVEVDGETVRPAEVTVERTRRVDVD